MLTKSFCILQHMVQNQMTPTYTYAAAGQPGLEDYHHQVVAASQATTVTSEPAMAQTAYTTPAAVTVTNGAVEQQTVRARPFNVRPTTTCPCMP